MHGQDRLISHLTWTCVPFAHLGMKNGYKYDAPKSMEESPMLSDISGSVIIAQTPFDDRGAVDFASIDSLTDFYLGHGANGFVVLGVSGEGGKLTSQEALDVSFSFIKRVGKKPVIVG